MSTDLIFHDAYLVESYRDAQGKPRQRTIGYLGNLREIDGVVPPIESELFLLRAAQRLRRLESAEPINVTAVIDDLRQQLPALTPEAAHHAFVTHTQWFYQWWSQHGSSVPEEEIMRVFGDVIGHVRERRR